MSATSELDASVATVSPAADIPPTRSLALPDQRHARMSSSCTLSAPLHPAHTTAPRRLLLEVCVDSFDSAETVIAHGADRLEVCSALGLGGGLTPSVSLVRLIRRAHPTVPVMVMIRPRPGDFVYSLAELETMAADIELVKELADPQAGLGFVFGCLTADGNIDEPGTRRLVEAASPCSVTFHRAFDMVYDARLETELGRRQANVALATRSMEALRRIGGISRVLTSGLSPSFPPSADWLAGLAASQPVGEGFPAVLPGSGVHARSLGALLLDGPTSAFRRALENGVVGELHASCSAWRAGPVDSDARRAGMGMGSGPDGSEGEWGRWTVEAARVRALRETMDRIVVDGRTTG